jgi:transposase InsO family protein
MRPVCKPEIPSAPVALSDSAEHEPPWKLLGHSPMERLFRSFKTEWLPSVGYMSAQEAHRDISHYLMHRYNWIRPHQFNDGLAPAVAEEKLNAVSGIS